MPGSDASATRRRPRHARTGADVRDLPIDRDGLHALRRAVAAHAGDLGVPAGQVDDILVVASELAANVVRHGGGRGRLRLWRHGRRLYCQVRDRGPGFGDPNVGSTPPDAVATSGRGIWICRQLCTELIIDSARTDQTGTTVTAVMDLAAEPTEPAGHPGRPAHPHDRRVPHPITRPTVGSGEHYRTDRRGA